jgi:hypothetical protein
MRKPKDFEEDKVVADLRKHKVIGAPEEEKKGGAGGMFFKAAPRPVTSHGRTN